MPYTDWTTEQLQKTGNELRALTAQFPDLLSIEFALHEIDLELVLRNLTEMGRRQCTS